MKTLAQYKLIAFCLLVFATTATYAQNTMEVGVIAGPNCARLYGNPNVNYNLREKTGFAAGAFFQYNFNDTWGLHTGLLFERKGAYTAAADNVFGNTVISTYHINYDYLSIPIMARATFMPVGGVRFFLNAGPYLGFLTRQATVTRVWQDDNRNDVNRSIDVSTNNYKGFDLGLAAGAGVRIPVGSNMGIGLEFRDNLGLLNVSESSNSDNRFKNNSMNFLASFSIGIK